MAKKQLNYLGSLQAYLDAIVESGQFLDPGSGKIEKNDVVLGDLPLEVKTIRTYLAKKNQEVAELIKKNSKRTLPRLETILREAEVLDKLVWFNLKTLYPKKSLKIVEGFKVVEVGKSEEEEAFENAVDKIVEALEDSAEGIAKIFELLSK